MGVRSPVFQQDENGVSSVVAFLVAGTLFTGIIGVVLYTGTNLGGPSINEQRDAQMQATAQDLAALLLGTSSLSVNGDFWLTDPDDLVRFGLLKHGNGTLDFELFQNLAAAPMDPCLNPLAACKDKLVNYPEARKALQLDETDLDFHIRAFPSLKSVREILETGTRDPNLRVTYLGHQVAKASGAPTPSHGLGVTPPTCTVGDDDKSYVVSTTVTNGGDTTTAFSARFHVVLNGVEADEAAHSFLVPPNGTTELRVRFPAVTVDGTPLRCSAGSTMEVEVWDPSSLLKDVQSTVGTAVTANGTAPRLLAVDPVDLYFEANKAVTVAYSGAPLPNNHKLCLTIRAGDDANGTIVYGPTTISVHNNPNHWTHKINAGFAAGEYRAYLRDSDCGASGGIVVSDRILVVAKDDEPKPYVPQGAMVTYSWDESVPIEVEFLHMLVEKFCPFEFDNKAATPLALLPVPPAPMPTWDGRCGDPAPPVHAFAAGRTPDQPGDVFPDDKHIANNDLRARIWDDGVVDPTQCGYSTGRGAPSYDVVNTLVVGSNVAHNSLTSEAIKGAIGDWVICGGTLIVFGHDSKNVQWLQSIFHAGIESSSGPIGIPDNSHPLLRVADLLSPQEYKHHDKSWKFNKQTEPLFTNVVVSDSDPVLAISNPGALGKGTVILTSWLPYSLFGNGADPMNPESLAVINNFLMQGYRDLFLDYGPPIPAGAGSGSAWRAAQIEHDKLGLIELTVQVWVFTSG